MVIPSTWFVKKCHKILALAVAYIVASSPALSDESPASWYQSGEDALRSALNKTNNENHAKNVILIVGDGMGISTVTASRIFDGQSRGEQGEENLLSFEHFPALALSKTYNTNQQTPDSAGTMTAMMSGIKTKAGFISVNQLATRGDCQSSQANHVKTLLEQAEDAGLATGIVSTARITHATPAATYAHTPERDWEDDSELPDDAKSRGCKDIAAQLIEFPYGDGVDVALGGGLRHFLPKETIDPLEGKPGFRLDKRNLVNEWKTNGGSVVFNREQLKQIDVNSTPKLLGLFHRSHMSFNQDRERESQEPSLEAMTQSAIDILKKNTKGFFLMVEAGRIDHAHHFGNSHRALKDTQELSRTVQLILENVDTKDTLIIVTADHSHTFTMAGYPTRGNPILGKVVGNNSQGEPKTTPQLALDKKPYTTLGYRNGRGFLVPPKEKQRGTYSIGRQDLSQIDTEHVDFHQEALVPMPSETHGGEDVAIYATGPWAHLFHSTHEQHYIYHVMHHALKKQLHDK
ncbi:alkaline phosphatase [Aurantivibrio plasticivorans]